MKKETELEEFDFGFTIVDESDIDSVKELQQESGAWRDGAISWEERCWKLRQAIEPLLKNLCVDPEREYLKWPDRVEKIQKFREHLDKVTGIKYEKN